MPIEKRKAVITAAIAVFTILIEWYYTRYMINHGLENKTVSMGAGQAGIPLVTLPAIGVFFVLLASWSYAGGATLPTRGRPEPKDREKSAWLALLKVALLLMAAFVTILLLPYALWSNWAWNFLGRNQGLVSLYVNTSRIWEMTPLWKYASSLNLSALITAILAVLYAHRSPKIKRLK